MKFSVWFFQFLLIGLLCAGLGGCVPPSQSDEEKEPHFMAGRSARNTMDYKGAIDEFEKAVEVNPHSASAHFELACLYDQNEPDPAAAIYHYEQYLKWRPNAGNAEIVKQRIYRCKQDLTKVVLPLPSTPGLQHELDQLAEENKQLRDELEKWRASARSQSPTNAPFQATAVAPRTNQILLPAPPINAPTQNVTGDTGSSMRTVAGRTHTVQSGETLFAIARKYGVKLDALLAANPGLDPKRLKVGQTLNVP